MDILSSSQISQVLNINRETLNILIKEEKIPLKNGAANTAALAEWLGKGPAVIMTREDAYLGRIRGEFESRFPEALAALREYNRECMEAAAVRRLKTLYRRGGKDYYLIKVPIKRGPAAGPAEGFRFYVRYREAGGGLLPSKWSTGTSVLKEAESFAERNRAALLARYYARRTPKPVPSLPPQGAGRPDAGAGAGAVPAAAKPSALPPEAGLYETLAACYQEGSAYLAAAGNRGRSLGRKTRSVYRNFMDKRLIPFLRGQGVKRFAEVTPPVVFKFQDHLLALGNSAGTVNRYLGSVKAVFDYYFMSGAIGYNVFNKARMLKTAPGAGRARGCLEAGRLRGVFARPWGQELHYLLCLLIYATGMRNSEIERLRPRDLLALGGCHFINIPQSKSASGVRKVPLHPFAREKLMAYIGKRNIGPGGYVFSAKGNANQSTLYRSALLSLGERIGMGPEALGERRITFYSGRHFWKTAMSAGGLGEDVEEYFMGHKVSADARKRYNHKDKRGLERTLEKAREVYAILDRELFQETGARGGG